MNFRKTFSVVLCVLLLAVFSGCSKEVEKDVSVSGGKSEGYLAKEENALDTESTVALPQNRKLIQTVHMNVETDNMEAVLHQIDSRIGELGGYVEASDVQNGSAYSGTRYRRATVTIRIPAKALDSFLNQVGEIINVVSSQKQVEDVTLNYVATESRVKALQTEENRLLELMTKTGTLEELLTVEKRLTEVRTELEKVTSTLKALENQVDYSTIHMNISEVKEFTDVSEADSMWERIASGFVKNLKNVVAILKELFVFFVVSLPYLAVVFTVPVGILLYFYVNKRKKLKKIKENQKNS